MVVAGIVGCDGWLADYFFLFSLFNTWICVVIGVEAGGLVSICWWCGGSVEGWLGLWVAMGGWPAVFSFFPLSTCGFVWSVEWRWVVLFQSVGGVEGQWNGGGLGFANLLVVAWIC